MTDTSALITRLEVIAKRYALDEVKEAVARIAELEDMIEGVSNGVQSYRTDIKMAVVWLPAIQRIREYLRTKDEAKAVAEFGED